MRASGFWRLICLLPLLPHSPALAADLEKQLSIKVTVMLIDDSQIKGEIPSPFRPLGVNSPLLGKVTVPMSNVVAITFVPDHAGAMVQLLNGDKIQGALALDSIRMKTLFGSISIPLTAIRNSIFRIAIPVEMGRSIQTTGSPCHFPKTPIGPVITVCRRVLRMVRSSCRGHRMRGQKNYTPPH